MFKKKKLGIYIDIILNVQIDLGRNFFFIMGFSKSE